VRAFFTSIIIVDILSSQLSSLKFPVAVFQHHRLVRTKTRQRIFKKFQIKIMALRAGKISEDTFAASRQSYLGVLSHADAYRLAKELENML
jgi:hypothetical protein